MESSTQQAAHSSARAEDAAPGLLLATERQRQGLSVGDVAAKLRMGIHQVEALENADYARLPTGTFLRGFVRSYAKLLGLDPQQALGLLEHTHSANPKPTIVVPSQNIKFTHPGEQFSTPRARAALIVILILAFAAGAWYWWAFIRPEQIAAAQAQPVKVAAAEKSIELPLPQTPQSDATTPASEVAQPATEAAEEQTTASAPETLIGTAAGKSDATAAKRAPPGLASLHFSFQGDSWVEVVDANGRTLVSHRYGAGEEQDISGRAPFSIVIGNATVTRMAYNGVDFDLTPHTRVAVARLNLK
jgi:cytoskeleton protein RodZ